MSWHERDREREREREKESDQNMVLNFLRQRKRKREMNGIFLKCIWENRTDNPSLAVKILNGTPRPTLPRERERQTDRERHRETEKDRARERNGQTDNE